MVVKNKMHREIPTPNKILSRKWQQRDMDIHLKKMKQIRPSIVISEPTRFKHLA